MTREEHLKAIWVVNSRKVGNHMLLVMLCSGPDCGGAEILARRTAADIAAEANAHIDKMEQLSAS